MASLDQRIDQILPSAPALVLESDAPLEPMPAEQQPELGLTTTDTTEPGTPSMDGVQLAGLFDKGVGAVVRGALKKEGRQAGRQFVPEAGRVAPDVLPPTGKIGSTVIVPEGSQTMTDQVQQAVSRRQKFSPLTGKPPEEAFNLANFADRDAAGVVAGVSDALGIKTKRVTFDQIKAKATDQGIDEQFLTRLIGTDGKMMANAVDTYKALEVLETSSKELDRLFKLVDAGQATDAQKLQLRQQIALHGLIQKGVKGIQTETARALAVFRIPRDGNADVIRKVLDEYGGENSLTDMARSYLSLESRAAKNQLVEKSMMSGIKDVWMTTWINGLLSSPVSHAKNVISGLAFGVYQMPERFIASLYSNVLPKGVRSWRSLVPGSAEEKIAYDEALTYISSTFRGMGEGFQLARKTWQEKMPQLDLASKVELQRMPQESMGETLQRTFNADPDSFFAKGLDFYGKAISLPGRALMTEDEFFKGTFYRMHMNTLIERRAKTVYREALDGGADEATALAKAELEAQSLFKNPPADLDEAAMEFAKRGTFTADLPPALEQLQRVFNWGPLKVVVPFFKTPANIGLEVVERTPFAPLSSRFRDDMAKGGIHRDMALAKVSMGSAILGYLAHEAASGSITGSGPTRKEHREALMRDGWQPYSLKIGEGYYSYAGMEPVSALLAIAADYAEYGMYQPDQGKVEEVFMGALFGMYEYLKEQPYLQGIGEIAKALGLSRAGQTPDAVKAVNDLTKQFSGFVIGGSPIGAYGSLVGAIERMYDPTAKGTRASPDLPMGVRGFVEGFNKYRSRIPAYNDDLPDELNLWGDPKQQIPSKNPWVRFSSWVNPTRVSPQQFSEVDDALARLGGPVGMPDKKLNGVELSDPQYNELLTIYGKELNAKQAILDVIQAPGFDMLNLDDQQKTVQRVHSLLMNGDKEKGIVGAKDLLISRNPELQAKLAELEELRKANGLYYKAR
jgi:hypothetical protein